MSRFINNYLHKVSQLNWFIFILVCLIAGTGFAMLYSAGDGPEPWMTRQIYRFTFGCFVLFLTALTPLEFWKRYAYHIYIISFVLLVLVEIKGYVGMGAQRWINVGLFKVQPSEIMKIAVILALARFFHHTHLQPKNQFKALTIPFMLLFAPALLILKQPDLGTTILIVMTGLSIIFLAGIRLWIVWSAIIAATLSLPLFWLFLKDYQKQRVLTFLNPESDPFGSGYQIIQSKIALGSGGLFGKGFMQGTQGSLDFLPEKQTDFIFSLLCEEYGFVGGIALIAVYMVVIGYCYLVGLNSKNSFSKYLCLGMATLIFLYVFINIAMVTGLVPVVGEPLPLISYGGTSLLTFMFGLGLVFCADLNRENRLGRAG